MAVTRRSQCGNPNSRRHDWFAGLRQTWPLSDGGPEFAAKSPNSLFGIGDAPGLPDHEGMLSVGICARSPRLVARAVDTRVVAASRAASRSDRKYSGGFRGSSFVVGANPLD